MPALAARYVDALETLDVGPCEASSRGGQQRADGGILWQLARWGYAERFTNGEGFWRYRITDAGRDALDKARRAAA